MLSQPAPPRSERSGRGAVGSALLRKSPQSQGDKKLVLVINNIFSRIEIPDEDKLEFGMILPIVLLLIERTILIYINNQLFNINAIIFKIY